MGCLEIYRRRAGRPTVLRVHEKSKYELAGDWRNAGAEITSKLFLQAEK